jgi:hypothetical protein
MTAHFTPTDSSERGNADILLRTALGMTAAVALSALLFWASNDPEQLISDGQLVALSVGWLAAAIGVPCWIALGIRTIIRGVRH